MTYSDVTLAPDDIEWVRLEDPVEVAIFEDEVFRNILLDRGPRDALDMFHAFHRKVANELIRTATDNPDASRWARRQIRLCGAAKWRRNTARRMFALKFGALAELRYRAELKAKYPRAEWGSAL